MLTITKYFRYLTEQKQIREKETTVNARFLFLLIDKRFYFATIV